MNAVALDVIQGTPEWLERRRFGIGSSDAPVIAGERGSVIELWAQKAGLVDVEEPDQETARLFEWGHRLEPVVADWYADTTGRKLKRVNRLLQHPDVPWAIASLDRETVGEKRIVEIKTTRFGWKRGEPVPGDVQTQVQHQLWVTGYPVADVAVLAGGSEPAVFEIARDQSFIDDLAFLETEFWDWVESKTRPPMDGSENARRILSHLHPQNNGSMLPANAETELIITQLRQAKAEAKEHEAAVGTLENAIRALIGDADGITGSFGAITWKRNADSSRTNWPAVAHGYRRMIEKAIDDGLIGSVDLDVVESIHTETVSGPRVLRTSFKEMK